MVGTVDDLRAEDRRVVDVGGRRIGVFSVGDSFFAVRDRCPHMGAPLCEGMVGGTLIASEPHAYVYGMEDRVVRRPWHGWEFDLTTRHFLMESSDVRVKVFTSRSTAEWSSFIRSDDELN